METLCILAPQCIASLPLFQKKPIAYQKKDIGCCSALTLLVTMPMTCKVRSVSFQPQIYPVLATHSFKSSVITLMSSKLSVIMTVVCMKAKRHLFHFGRAICYPSYLLGLLSSEIKASEVLHPSKVFLWNWRSIKVSHELLRCRIVSSKPDLDSRHISDMELDCYHPSIQHLNSRWGSVTHDTIAKSCSYFNDRKVQTSEGLIHPAF